jgi:ubiquinone/menaquinone biosynthesis C-methylase UbiE
MITDGPEPGESREIWGSGDAASGWKRGAAARGRALDPMTGLMLDLTGVTLGSRVLDIGAGTGDQTLMAARRVGPQGMVLATDVSATMLALTLEAAREAGLANVETRVMDAQELELESGSFDAAVARFSLQFVPDVGRALAEVRRVLTPGGRFAAAVFSTIERNPFRATPLAIASRLAGRPFPAPGPGQWALNEAATLRQVFQHAGFRDVEVRPVPFTYRFESLADALRNVEESQPPFVRLMDQLGEEHRAAARSQIRQALQRFEGPDGFVAPSEALMAIGAA